MKTCPYSFLRLGKCQKTKCEKYIVVTENHQEGREIKQRQVGHCTDLQATIMLLEIAQTQLQILDIIKNIKTK